MAIKTLELALGALPVGGLGYQTGWYYDTESGVWYYYDAVADRWYSYVSGQLYALSTRWVAAPKTVDVAIGDKLKIVVDFYYRGPAFSGKLYGAIGQKVLTAFDEILNSSISLSLPAYTTITRVTGKYLEIPITSAIAAGTYHIYAKITNGIGVVLDQTLSSYYENAVRVVGVTPEFSQFAIADYVKV